MNRREFLKRMAAVGLVAAAPPIIFDMGAHSGLYGDITLPWRWMGREEAINEFGFWATDDTYQEILLIPKTPYNLLTDQVCIGPLAV